MLAKIQVIRNGTRVPQIKTLDARKLGLRWPPICHFAYNRAQIHNRRYQIHNRRYLVVHAFGACHGCLRPAGRAIVDRKRFRKASDEAQDRFP